MQKIVSGSEGEVAEARRRGRPRAFDRDAALAKATHLFWSKGYGATSIADLTAAMGIVSTSLYAAFGSKEQLFIEALQHYQEEYRHLVWEGFSSAPTARAAVEAFLMDSAAALTGTVADIPPGCMVTLSAAGSEGYAELGALVREARATTVERVSARIRRAIDDGELPPTVDSRTLGRFVQGVQYGMALLARDGVSREELEGIARVAMAGWDGQVATAGS